MNKILGMPFRILTKADPAPQAGQMYLIPSGSIVMLLDKYVTDHMTEHSCAVSGQYAVYLAGGNPGRPFVLLNPISKLGWKRVEIVEQVQFREVL